MDLQGIEGQEPTEPGDSLRGGEGGLHGLERKKFKMNVLRLEWDALTGATHITVEIRLYPTRSDTWGFANTLYFFYLCEAD